MTRRIRPLMAAGFGLAMLLLQLATVFSRGTQTFWAREYASALDWALGPTPLVAACLAGFAAFSTHAVSPGRTPREKVAHVRSLRLVGFAVAPGLLAALTSTAVTVLAALAVVHSHRGDVLVPHSAGLLWVVLAMYLAAAVGGAALGVLLPGPVVPFLLAVAGMLAFFLARPLHAGRLVRIGGGTGSVADQQLRWGTLLTWCLAWLLLAVLPLLVLLAVERATQQTSAFAESATASGGIVLGAVLIVSLLGTTTAAGGDGAVYAQNPAPADRCATAEGITACTRQDSGFDPATTARALAPYVRAVDSLRAAPPISRWGVMSLPGDIPAGTGLVTAGSSPSARPLDYELSEGALAGPGCPRLLSQDKYLSVLTVGSEWLSTLVTGRPSAGVSAPQAAWLRTPAARSWVAGAVWALRRCDIRGITAPPGWQTSETGLEW